MKSPPAVLPPTPPPPKKVNLQTSSTHFPSFNYTEIPQGSQIVTPTFLKDQTTCALLELWCVAFLLRFEYAILNVYKP